MTDSNSPPKSTYKSYLIFWSGQQVSQIGSSIVQFALIWWITITTQSGFYLALSSLLGIGSTILTQFVAGAVADRFDRKKIIFTTDMGQAVATVLLMYLFYINNATLFSVFTILTIRGFFGGFHAPATNAIIPAMVPKNRLKQMNSYANLSSSILNIFSPTISALLLAVFGLDKLFLILSIDVFSFVIAIIPLFIIDIPSVKKTSLTSEISFKQEVTMGWSYIKNSPGFMTLLISFSMINFFLTPSFALLPLIVSSGLGGTEFTLAVALALMQVGSIVTSFFFSRKSDKSSLLSGVFLGILLINFSLILIGFTALNKLIIAFYGGMLLIGIGLAMGNIHSRTIWQSYIPVELQGRIMSVRITMASLVSPISLVIFGLLSEHVLPATLLIYSGILSTIIFVILWFTTSIRQITDRSESYSFQPTSGPQIEQGDEPIEITELTLIET